MRYTIIVSKEIRETLRTLPLGLRREIGRKLFLLEDDLAGDIKKLRGSRQNYRLRVGDYRILFKLEGSTATVYGVGLRKDVYQ